jgi:hypothetical protein
MVSGTIKRQKGHFVRVESTTNYREEVSKAYDFETSSFSHSGDGCSVPTKIDKRETRGSYHIS